MALLQTQSNKIKLRGYNTYAIVHYLVAFYSNPEGMWSIWVADKMILLITDREAVGKDVYKDVYLFLISLR